MRISNGIIGWSLFFILVIADSVSARQKNSQNTLSDCRRSVQGFYNEFVGKGPKSPKAELSAELRQQLKEDDDNKMDESGFIVGPDFDPIAAGNDVCTRYQAGEAWRRGDRCLVEVYCIWGNKRDAKKKMVHELIFNRGPWVIINIHYYYYEIDRPPHKSDSLSTSKRLRDERRKNPR